MATVTGNDGNNNLNGTNDDDDIFGEGGNDTIDGGDGNDTIYGDVPQELLSGGKAGKVLDGNDVIDGGDGNDVIFGDGGDDTIVGGAGADTLYGDYSPALAGINKIGKALAKAPAGDDVFQFENIGDGYGDIIFGGDGSTPGANKGKAGKGTDNDTLDLTNTTLGGTGITANITTTTDSDGNGFDGTVTWVDGQGNVVGTLQFENIENIIDNSMPCFVSGTLIDTPKGSVPVDTLQVGDEVLTADNGAQTIRWIGAKQVGPKALEENLDLRPIRIKAGALGEGLPKTDLCVSPQHRVLLQSKIVENVFGEKEVLVAAKKLLSLPGVSVQEDVNSLTYWHILFDQHEIVFSNGAKTESLFLGHEGLKAMSEDARQEIYALFPELLDPEYLPQSSRPLHKKAGKIKNLVARHVKNGKPLQLSA